MNAMKVYHSFNHKNERFIQNSRPQNQRSIDIRTSEQ